MPLWVQIKRFGAAPPATGATDEISYKTIENYLFWYAVLLPAKTYIHTRPGFAGAPGF